MSSWRVPAADCCPSLQFSLDADITVRIPELLDSYFALTQQLYDTGARKFLFIGVPPFDRNPGLAGTDTTNLANWINEFNGQLGLSRVQAFASANPDVSDDFFSCLMTHVFSRMLSNFGH